VGDKEVMFQDGLKEFEVRFRFRGCLFHIPLLLRWPAWSAVTRICHAFWKEAAQISPGRGSALRNSIAAIGFLPLEYQIGC